MQYKLKTALIALAIAASIAAIFCRGIVWSVAAVAVLFLLLVYGEDIWKLCGKLSPSRRDKPTRKWYQFSLKAFMLVLIPLGAAFAWFAAVNNRIPDELLGDWVDFQCEVDGQISGDRPYELTICADGTVRCLGYGERSFQIKVETHKRPKTIDIHREDGEIVRGIYSVDRGLLRIFIRESSERRPRDFDTRVGDGREIYFLKRSRRRILVSLSPVSAEEEELLDDFELDYAPPSDVESAR